MFFLATQRFPKEKEPTKAISVPTQPKQAYSLGCAWANVEVCAKQNRHVQSCAAGICVLCWPDLDTSFYDVLSTIGVCDPASFGKILELDRVVDFPNTIIFDNQVSGQMKKPAVANQKNLCQGLLRAELCSGKLKEVDWRPKDI